MTKVHHFRFYAHEVFVCVFELTASCASKSIDHAVVEWFLRRELSRVIVCFLNQRFGDTVYEVFCTMGILFATGDKKLICFFDDFRVSSALME